MFCHSSPMQCMIILPPLVAHIGNVKQLKDPDSFCHELSAPDTCNSKAALVCDTVSGSNPITKDGSDPSSSSIPPTEDVDASVKGPSAGAQLGYVNEGEDGSPDIDEESGADDPEEAVLRERSNNTQFLNEHGAGKYRHFTCEKIATYTAYMRITLRRPILREPYT